MGSVHLLPRSRGEQSVRLQRYHLDANEHDRRHDGDDQSLQFISRESDNLTQALEFDLDPSQYCSECFLLLWRQRLLSPTLPTSDYSTYLVEQFELLQQNCSTTLSYSTSSSTLFVSSASATATATATTISTIAASTTCAGQVVTPVASGPPLACYALSEQYNVSTGTMMTITEDVFCGFNETQCFPGPCELQQIYGGTW